ncbi:fumarate hydratase class I, anaerobic [bacterium BMS3Abin05]|nr:fumarate hydratase class I, anaerobic [bacterium BMS3Abin05]
MHMHEKKIIAPLTDDVVKTLRVGDNVLITGTIYTARDAAHKRLVDLLNAGKALPIPLKGQVIYYVGPAPAHPGKPIGPAGPTTSYRMNPYAPYLIEQGLKGMIGKGEMGENVAEAMKKHGAVYFAATGGAAALIARSIKHAEIVAYEDLGAEAIRKLEVENFPVVVAQDCYGGNIYKEGVAKYHIAS